MPDVNYEALLRRALTSIERLENELAAQRRAQHAEVAVIGLACRLPGADGPEAFWRLLRDGEDHVALTPKERWDGSGFNTPGTAKGHYIDDVRSFDHAFFGISKAEAEAMDPQHRIALQEVWHALEDARIDPQTLAGSNTGVYVGISSQDYAVRTFANLDAVSAYVSTGTAHSAAAGRISYYLGAHGPSVAVDTACSSSLTATHLAVQALRRGEADLAVVVGVHLVLAPHAGQSFDAFGMLSPDGMCHAFDASANGFGRGEGCVVAILERLDDAMAADRHVHAVIKGSAINQDGRTSGLTAPNGGAQAAVMHAALRDADLDAAQIALVEAHGTGTPLGDPIEVEAIAEVYGGGSDPCWLGAGKANVGHGEAAAGLTSLLKAALSLSHREVPTLHGFRTANPNMPLAGTRLQIPLQPEALGCTPDQPLYAGVSSFGFGGSNAHVVLGTAPPRRAARPAQQPEELVLPVSASSGSALDALRTSLVQILSHAGQDAADVCLDAATGRAQMGFRVAAHGADAVALAQALGSATLPSGPVRRHQQPVFLFTGQGSQRAGMGRRLFEIEPAFRESMEACHEVLREELDHGLLDVLYRDPELAPLVDDTAYTQPALVALECSMVQLWASHGVVPAAVAGHSIGEFAAAVSAGMLTRDDALRFAAARGRLMQEGCEPGAMAVVLASPAVAQRIAGVAQCEVAAINHGANATLSGTDAQIARALEVSSTVGVETIRLPVKRAFHSRLMDPILPALRAVAREVPITAPQIPFVSSRTGKAFPWDEPPNPDYWTRQARGTVQFAACASALLELGHTLFLEVGPAPSLLPMVERAGAGAVRLVPTLTGKADDVGVFTDATCRLFEAGVDIHWQDGASARAPLPSYPFDPVECWLAPTL